MTPDLEPLVQAIEEENELRIPMEKEEMVQTSERTTSEGHGQQLPICVSGMKETMNYSRKHHKEQSNVDETRGHIGTSFVYEKKKRKQMSPIIVQDTIKGNSDAIHLENLKIATLIPIVDSTKIFTMSIMKDLIISSPITNKRHL